MQYQGDPGYYEWPAEQEQAQADEAAYYASAEGEAMAEIALAETEAVIEAARRFIDALDGEYRAVYLTDENFRRAADLVRVLLELVAPTHQ